MVIVGKLQTRRDQNDYIAYLQSGQMFEIVEPTLSRMTKFAEVNMS